MFTLKSVFIITNSISEVKKAVSLGSQDEYEIVNYKFNEFNIESTSFFESLTPKKMQFFRIHANLKLKEKEKDTTEIVIYSGIRPEVIFLGFIFIISSGYLFIRGDESFPNIIVLFLIAILFLNAVLKIQDKWFHSKIKRIITDSVK